MCGLNPEWLIITQGGLVLIDLQDVLALISYTMCVRDSSW